MRTIFALGVAGLLAGCGTQSETDIDTLKIMWIEPLSGPLASVGRPGLDTWRFAVDEMNAAGGILDRQIELVTCDNKGNARESTECVERAADEGIAYVAQGMSSAAAGAVLEAVNKHNARNEDKILYVNWASLAERLTGELCSYWQFRTETHLGQRTAALADYLARSSEPVRLYIINQDYSMGQSAEEALTRELSARANGVEVVATERHPFNRVSDWRPYVDKIAQSGATAVFTANWGQDLLRLVRTANEAGLDVDWYTIFGGLRGNADAVGRSGIGRFYLIADYHHNVDDPEWADRQRRYAQRMNDEMVNPGETRALTMLKSAAEKAGSLDPSAVAVAWEGLEVKVGRSSVRMRSEDHQAEMPLVVAVLSDDVEFTQGETGLGFRTVEWIDAEGLDDASSCRMDNRPS